MSNIKNIFCRNPRLPATVNASSYLIEARSLLRFAQKHQKIADHAIFLPCKLPKQPINRGFSANSPQVNSAAKPTSATGCSKSLLRGGAQTARDFVYHFP
jgi:hypothetical protein